MKSYTHLEQNTMSVGMMIRHKLEDNLMVFNISQALNKDNSLIFTLGTTSGGKITFDKGTKIQVTNAWVDQNFANNEEIFIFLTLQNRTISTSVNVNAT